MRKNKGKETFVSEHTLQVSQKVYRVVAMVCVLTLAILLTATVLNLPQVGRISNPDNNEVSERYIEKGIEETGAVNFVAGMILDYRAFDTFGESNVLFVATICVTVMLRISSKNTKKRRKKPASDKDESDVKDKQKSTGTKAKKEKTAAVTEKSVSTETSTETALERTRTEEELSDRFYEPEHDTILQIMSVIVFPIIMVFGIYVVLNGHLSPGGGFSGGAVLGAGFILYLNAFGFEKTERFMNANSVKWITFSALMVYCLAKSYSFFTGANHLESHIPLGTPGAILSSGLILILNICVGMVVACTMYSFYALVRRGRI